MKPPARPGPIARPECVWLGGVAFAAVTIGLGVSGSRPEPAAASDEAVELARRVRSILAGSCFKCHGPDDAARQADLRLDRREDAVAPFEDGGAVIVPGDAAASELIRRVTSTDADYRMPPPRANKDALSPDQIDVLRRWIDDGATWASHWSFEPPTHRPLPGVSSEGWCRDDIDRWVLWRLDKEGLRPSAEADRATLLRRVSLDLTGLPPGPAEIEAFLSDPAQGAYERAVDRLLASPRYGEKWARWWLDLARYADTKGYEKDERRTMWPYRDWLIRAFNADVPFDRFTIEQLAGDMLEGPPELAPDRLIATAFNRNTMTNDEGGTDDEEFRVAAVIDRVNTTMEVWQGLTMGCAQCHSHKYDPIAHTDYYRLLAIFNNTQDADRPDESPTLRIAREEDEKELADVQAAIKALEPPADPPVSLHPDAQAELEGLRARRQEVTGRIANLPVMRERDPAQRRVTHRFTRGSFLSPAEPVEPGIPEFLANGTAPEAPDRLALARWLVSEHNPLTARVIVNRIWEQLFGTGLVETVEDFGTQGTPPTHPELLDHLAIGFQSGGWSVKSLLRRIVTSSTYRQSSAVTPDLLSRDPANRLLARGPRFRLDGETIRDQALASSGLLSGLMYGPPVFPPQPDGLWIMIYSGDKWVASEGEDRHRRAIYTFWRRTVPYPSMTTFDAPSREFCVSRRIRTNTPLQAFVTLNDPAFVECARAMGRRVLREAGPGEDERIAYAFLLAVCRRPTPEESAEIARLLADQRALCRADPDAAIKAAGLSAGDPSEDAIELAAWSAAAGVLLNLDETLTKE